MDQGFGIGKCTLCNDWLMGILTNQAYSRNEGWLNIGQLEQGTLLNVL